MNGRQIATLRNGGELCDIRRHSNGFLYNPHRVAIAEQLLEWLPDYVTLQFSNMDTGDRWTCSTADFRQMAKRIQYGTFEPQRAAEVALMTYTSSQQPRKTQPGSGKPSGSQLSLFGR